MKFADNRAVKELCRVADIIYNRGWGEANGGNISMRLNELEAADFVNKKSIREIKLGFNVPALAGDYFLITATGCYSAEISNDPDSNLGIVRVNETGTACDVLYGYHGMKGPTSELSSHLLSLEVLKNSNRGRVVLHTHAQALIELTFKLPLDSAIITRELWEMMSECLVLFPRGVSALPWMVPGSLEIGAATAKQLTDFDLVLWAHHGVFAVGSELKTALGLIETADKAARMLLNVGYGQKKQTIKKEELISLAKAFGITPYQAAIDCK